MYRSLLFSFIFYIRRPANIEAETNSYTLIQFVRIKDIINNVFTRARFSEIEVISILNLVYISITYNNISFLPSINHNLFQIELYI